ncbi:MAG TPA: ATP-binding cassette domain-containing protein, partial [Casimicrobiaceae bacterium]
MSKVLGYRRPYFDTQPAHLYPAYRSTERRVLAVLARAAAGGDRDVRAWRPDGRRDRAAPSLAAEPHMTHALRTQGLSKSFGAFKANSDITLAFDAGSRHALIGPNGAGKTTLLLTLMGLTRLKRGSVAWEGADIARLPTFRRAQAGLGWVPQERFMFPSLTVEEHLSVVSRPGPWSIARAYQYFPKLEERRLNLGNQLSGGEQRMLAIARALMTNP